MLHDPDAEKSLVVVFFETEDDYTRGDATLSAMPAGDTPGQPHVRHEVRRRDSHVRLSRTTASTASASAATIARELVVGRDERRRDLERRRRAARA